MAVLADLPASPSVSPQVQLYAVGRDGPVRWRMLSANHRDLGRGADEFDSESDCRMSIDRLLDRLADLVPSLCPTSDHRWSWRLLLDGDVVVMSGHAFDRRFRCATAANRFVLLAPDVQIKPGVMVLSARGRPSLVLDPAPGGPLVDLRTAAVHLRSGRRSSSSGELPQARVPAHRAPDTETAEVKQWRP